MPHTPDELAEFLHKKLTTKNNIEAIKIGFYFNYRNNDDLYKSIDFNKETIQSRRLLVYIITSIINSKYIEYVNKNEYNLKLFISCVDRVLNYKYVSDNDKIIIRKSLSRLKFLKYPT